MAAKNVGTLILEARTAKKISQTALASEVGGLSGGDIGKAERGEKELSQAQLKAIAKALGITQKSLLEAPKGGTAGTAAKKTAAKTTAKTSSAKTTAAKKTAAPKTTSAAKTGTAAKKTAAKKTTTAAKKTSTAATVKDLSAAEVKLVELYRSASSDNKKLAAKILKGEGLELGDLLPSLMNNSSNSEDGLLGALLGKMQGLMK